MQEINQQNLRLLIPGKAAGVAGLISKNTGMPLKEALLLFYRSSLYKQLEREETKVWHYSPAQLYELGFRRLSRHKRNGPGHSKLAAKKLFSHSPKPIGRALNISIVGPIMISRISSP